MAWVIVITAAGVLLSLIFAGIAKRDEFIDKASKLSDDKRDKIIISKDSHHDDVIR